MSVALLPGIRITFEICLLTATLADKDTSSLTHCYETICQIAKKVLLNSSEFISDCL